MRTLLLSMTAAVLMAGIGFSSQAQTFVYTVDVGAGFGMMSAPNVSGQSEIVNVGASGYLNPFGNSVDFDVINDIVLGTDREPNGPTDTITENFLYRIRIAEIGVIGNTVALGLEPEGNRGITFAEFTQRGRYTLSFIRAGSVIGELNTPLGGDIDDVGNPIVGEQSQATAFVPGFGNVTIASKWVSLPAGPESVPPTGGITARQFEDTGSVTNRLSIAPSFVSIGGKVTLQSVQNAVQPIQFTFKPITGSAFTRTATLDSLGNYTFSHIPANYYHVSIKGEKWLRENIPIDAQTGSVSNANASLFAGDANNDNFADINDLLALVAHYNRTQANGGFLAAADFNCDNSNDILDLLLLIANYNKQGDALP